MVRMLFPTDLVSNHIWLFLLSDLKSGGMNMRSNLQAFCTEIKYSVPIEDQFEQQIIFLN